MSFTIKMKSTVLCLAVLLCYNSIAEGKSLNERALTIEDAPWSVIVERGGEHVILGSIVGPNLVASSTRYINHVDPINFVVRAGSAKVGSGGSTHNITNVFTHPKATDEYYDVGVFTVDPPFQLDETRQIIKLNRNAGFEEDATVYYYNDDGDLSITQLMVKDRVFCDAAWPPGYGPKESQVCAISAIRGDGPCRRDLGAAVLGNDGTAHGILGEFTFCYKLDHWPLNFTNLTEIHVSMWLEANVPDV